MKSLKIEIKWAIIFTIMMLVWVFVEKLIGLHDSKIEMHPIFTNLVAIPSFYIYFLGLKEKKNSLKNPVFTWKQGFITGLIITVMVAVVSPLGQYITHNFITPDYFKNVINYAVNTNHMTQSEAEKYFTLKNYMLQASFGSLIVGTITAAIVAFFVKTKNNL